MSNDICMSLAIRVIDGYPLSEVRRIYGTDAAVKVNALTVTRPWQVVKWVRRIR